MSDFTPFKIEILPFAETEMVSKNDYVSVIADRVRGILAPHLPVHNFHQQIYPPVYKEDRSEYSHDLFQKAAEPQTREKALRHEEINGLSFLDLTREDFERYGFKGGPATLLAKEATYKLDDDDEELVVYKGNKAQSSVKQVNKKNRKRKSGEAFREDLDISTESLQQPRNESALKEGSEEEKDLRKNVKRVMEVIVGLLKDRLESVHEEPDRKKARIGSRNIVRKNNCIDVMYHGQ
ncbi:hypothetical protein C1646_812712 [Rhizophagus diaphanus]|nr:hypothetical protein C1646_812712 [Rhizophagus diaphanus] [Rhizophagus sp. MUCL 43196]